MTFGIVMRYLDFRDLVNMVLRIQDKCFFNFEKTYLAINCVDNAHVCMIRLQIPSGAFESYEIDEPFKIGLELNKLKWFTEMAYGFIHITEIGDNTINLQSGKFSLVMIGVDEVQIKKEPDEPSLSYISSMIVKSSDMRKFLKPFKNDITEIRVSGIDNTSFFTADDFTYAVDNYIGKSDVSTIYSFDYFKSMFRDVKGDVMIELSDDHPCKVHLNLNGIYIGYYLLAPRIKGD